MNRDPEINKKYWLERKKEFMKRIEMDKEIGYLDPGIEVYLAAINNREKSFTTSSCIGRVTIVDADYPWQRKESSVIFKKHNELSKEELENIIRIPPARTYWLNVNGPILHINTLNLNEAVYILEKAREAGFKHSGIMNISRNGIMVELISGTQFAIPLRTKDTFIIDTEEGINEIITIVNKTLKEGRERLKKLKQGLEAD